MAFIIDTTNQQVISPSDLFGNESNSLLEACYRIFQGSLYPYKGVYNSPLRPSILQYRQEYLANGGDPKDFIYFTRHEIKFWNESHPEEIEKEARSRKEWEKNRENDFQFIAKQIVNFSNIFKRLFCQFLHINGSIFNNIINQQFHELNLFHIKSIIIYIFIKNITNNIFI